MKFSKAFKRLNPAPLLRGSCVRSQNAVADGEEVAALKCPETALMVSESKSVYYIPCAFCAILLGQIARLKFVGEMQYDYTLTSLPLFSSAGSKSFTKKSSMKSIPDASASKVKINAFSS